NRQAEAISRLPILAQTLLPCLEVPWAQAPSAATAISTQDWRGVRRSLLKLGTRYLENYSATGLIPTAPETITEGYVDTMREADLIVLASKLGETGLAKEILAFYWTKSQGGQNALHAAYDAKSGTAKTAELISERPRNSVRTADAQLAIADAAFAVGLQTSDPKWLRLGRNLTDLVLTSYREARLPSETNKPPRGICQYPFLSTKYAYGLTLWPEAKLYPVRSNARAYLLLRQLEKVMDSFSSDNHWRQQ